MKKTSQNIPRTISFTEFLQINTANKAKHDELPPTIATEKSNDFNDVVINENMSSKVTSTNIKKKRKRVNDDRLYKTKKNLSFNPKTPKTDASNISITNDDDDNNSLTQISDKYR